MKKPWAAQTEWRSRIVPREEHYGSKSPLWTIATLTVPGREERLEKLKAEIARQTGDLPVEHLIHAGPNHYGTEMRKSTEEARGRNISWLDDDDWVADGYVSKICKAIADHLPDVVTFGDHCPSGHPAWLRSNREDQSQRPGEITEGVVMMANHYCAWRRDLALTVPWLPRNYGAEWCWLWLMQATYPSLSEVHIPEILYIYNYDAKDTKCQNRAVIDESLYDGGGHLMFYRHRDGRVLIAKHRDTLGPLNFVQVQQASGTVVPAHRADVTLLREVVFK